MGGTFTSDSLHMCCWKAEDRLGFWAFWMSRSWDIKSLNYVRLQKLLSSQHIQAVIVKAGQNHLWEYFKLEHCALEMSSHSSCAQSLGAKASQCALFKMRQQDSSGLFTFLYFTLNSWWLNELTIRSLSFNKILIRYKFFLFIIN